jgi:hypothetical protein
MTFRRGTIPPKAPVFLGCEGAGEVSYGALLEHCVRSMATVHVHIQPVSLNPGAGDPLALVEKALQCIQKHDRERVRYKVRAILLDSDRVGQTPDRDRRALQLAQESDLQLIWQRPRHEAFLLRHLDGCQQLRPDAAQCFLRLAREWPEYRKPMSMAALAERISIDHINRAANVEPELQTFLRRIGWL